MKLLKAGTAIAVLLTVSACSSHPQDRSTVFGQSVKNNMAAMVDDPTPIAHDPVPNAIVIDAAIDRYRHDAVIQPEADAGFSDSSSDGG